MMARMKNILLFIFLLAARTEALELVTFPQAVIQGDVAIFIGRTADDRPVETALNEVPLSTETPVDGKLEFHLKLTHGGVLTFQQGDVRHSFRVTSPEEDLILEQRGGFLFSEETPVILLPRPIGRYLGRIGWEALGVLGNLISWKYQPEDGVTLLTAHHRQEGFQEEWRRLTPPASLFETKEMIATLTGAPSSEVLVVAPSANDLERGVEGELFQTQLAWLLQWAGAHGYKQRYLVNLPLTAEQFARFPLITREMRLTAASASATFINVTEKEKNWADGVARGLQKGGVR